MPSIPALAGFGFPLFHRERFFRFVFVFSDDDVVVVVVVVFEESVEDWDLNSEGRWGLFVW